MLVVGDSTALYVAHGLAAWTMAHPDHAQVSVSWCQGCTFVLDADIVSFDLDDVLDNSRRTITEVMPDAIEQAAARRRGDDGHRRARRPNRQWSDTEGPLAPTDPRSHDRMVEAYADLTMQIISSGVPDVVWVVPPTPTHQWDDDPEMNEVERYSAHHEIIREATARFEHHVSVVDLDAWVGGHRPVRRPHLASATASTSTRPRPPSSPNSSSARGWSPRRCAPTPDLQPALRRRDVSGSRRSRGRSCGRADRPPPCATAAAATRTAAP